MKVIESGFEILTPISDGGIEELKMIERIARVCYKSEDKITEDGESAKKIVRSLVKNGHMAMLEHSILSVKFVTDRGITHEIVRHRMASFAQESTRYCNYSKDKFGKEITVVSPSRSYVSDKSYDIWYKHMLECEGAYFELIERGVKPEVARNVLPTSLKAELVMTANYREWRHFLTLRGSKNAHFELSYLVVNLKKELQRMIPVVFDDI